MERPELRAATARGALDRAAAARGPEALAWLERARRLSPDDPTIAFMVASALLPDEPRRARAMLAALLARHPRFRDAAIGLAACEWRLGDADAAARHLGAVLSAWAAPGDPAFRTLADAICRGAGLPGWVGVDGGGGVMARARGPVRLALDGVTVASGAEPAGSRLPTGWLTADFLTAEADGRALLGSPTALAPRGRAEGFVGDFAPGEDLCGWAWLPADPERPARLAVLVDGASHAIEADDDALAPAQGHVLDRRRGFRIPAAAVAGAGEIRVLGPDGRDLAGSPLHPGREAEAARAAAARLGGAQGESRDDAWRPLDAGLLPPLATIAPARRVRRLVRAVDVIIPVWNGAADLAACLATLDGALPAGGRVVVVDDGSTEPALAALLAALQAGHADERAFVVLRHAANRGFPAAANTGLRQALAAGRDALLLNPDTLLPRDAVVRLARAAHAAADIGSATPMTNDGTICSYAPAAGLPDAAGVRRLDALVRRANGEAVVEIPTAVGFCMYVRHDCLAATGLFREDAFAQGYGEENDFCLRARHLGWRHVVATGVFVAHRGGRSFGAVRADLMARNARALNRLHPGYDALVGRFRAVDPLRPARHAIDRARFVAGTRDAGAVVLVTHGQGGGIARFLAGRAAAIRAEGMRPILLRPAPDSVAVGGDAVGEDGGDYPDLHFPLPEGMDAVVGLLAAEGARLVELHQFIGHRFDPAGLARRLAVPFAVVVHDSALWCPRVTFTAAADRYCGEPADIAVCEACVRDLGGRLREDIGVAALRTRSRGWLAAAERVVVSCDDAARRARRQFPDVRPTIEPWEDAAPPRAAAPAAGGPAAGCPVRVVVVGAIGPEKGYAVLLDCARDAARRGLALHFTVVGHTVDDARLLETGRVFVTGPFAEGEAAALVATQGGQLGFVPSVVPETWCYALSALWEGGLRVACFALGAQAERVVRSGAGAVLPLGLPAARVNDLLLTLSAPARAAG